MKTQKKKRIARGLLTVAFGLGFVSGHTQNSIINPVSISPTDLAASQQAKYHWYKDSLTKYSGFTFCRMYVDSSKFDSLGRFLVVLPSVFPKDLIYNVTYKQICSRAEVLQSAADIEAIYYQGQYFRYGKPDDEADDFGYASFRFLMSDKHTFTGHIQYEDDKYDLVDLGNDLQMLCKVKDNYYDGMATCKDDIEVDATAVASSTCGNKIRILLIYTENAMRNMGAWHGAAMETPEITQHAWSCISDLNAIWANSGVNATAELAAIKFLQIGESGDPGADVTQTLPASTTIDGWRTQYRGDLVCQFTGNYSGILGRAAAIGASKTSAFCIVEPEEASGDLHVFAHEMGHLFGCAHDTEPMNTARGHSFKTGTNSMGMGGKKRATVMSLTWQEHRIPHYSNPNVGFMNVPTGTGNRNSAGDGVMPFTDIIDDFYPDHDLTIRFERINCDEYKEYWWLEAKDICLEGLCGPFQMEWYWVELTQWFPIFHYLGTGNQYWQYIPYSAKDMFVVLFVKDCNGNLVFAKSHIMKGRDANGGCLTYRTSQATGSSDVKAEGKLEILPNPNAGNFSVKSANVFSGQASVTVYDALGHELKDAFVVKRLSDNELELNSKISLAKGLYIVHVNSGQEIITKRILITYD